MMCLACLSKQLIAVLYTVPKLTRDGTFVCLHFVSIVILFKISTGIGGAIVNHSCQNLDDQARCIRMDVMYVLVVGVYIILE